MSKNDSSADLKSLNSRWQRPDGYLPQTEIDERRGFMLAMGLPEEAVNKYAETRPELVDKETFRAAFGILGDSGFENPTETFQNFIEAFSLSPKYIEDKISGLKGMGFEDPIKALERFPRLIAADIETLRQKAKTLKSFGFKNIMKMAQEAPSLLFYDPLTLRERPENLKRLGWKKPYKFYEGCPSHLYEPPEYANDEVDFLRSKGFKNPAQVIERNGNLVRSKDGINQRMGHYEKLHYDPVRMMERNPSLLNLSTDTTDNRAVHLRELGFATDDDPKFRDIPEEQRPLKLVERYANVLSYPEETLVDKLVDIEKLGFADAVALVEKYPSIIGLSLNNISRKVRYIDKVVKLYGYDMSAQEIMLRQPAIFGSKEAKLQTLVRVLRFVSTDSGNITIQNIKKLLFSNLEDVVTALTDGDFKGRPLEEFIEHVAEIKKMGFSKEEKRELIMADEGLDPKIKLAYKRTLKAKEEEGEEEIS